MRRLLHCGSIGALAALVLMPACGARESEKPAATADTANPAPSNQSHTLDALLKREATDLEAAELAGQSFRVRPLVKGGASVSAEKGLSKLILPIGSEAPKCRMSPRRSTRPP